MIATDAICVYLYLRPMCLSVSDILSVSLMTSQSCCNIVNTTFSNTLEVIFSPGL
uniref:Uncharacterized protein n=1 Tax=Arion vulgaris TaxID=1028688 RepID=A0A0B6XYG1_9EUPU